MPLHRPLAVLLVALGALATACSGTAPEAPTARSYDPAVRTETLVVDGRERSYQLQPSAQAASGRPGPLVVVLHQEGGTPDGIAAETALTGLRAEGVTLAYPAGVDRSWGAGACCGTPRKTGVDDVAFLDALLADIEEQAPVDTARTAFVGYSSGGMLTYRYVCGRPGRLAAAVVVSASLESPCEGRITAPDVLAVHGKKDGTVGFDRSIFVTALGLAPRPAAQSLETFTASAGCSPAPRTTQLPDAEVRLWQDCRGGDVEATVVTEGGHGWAKLDASRRTRDFLETHLFGA